ncbi:hypothetical protein HXX76_014184 [Chlamydomonas incerta]|nr:hypothetical protein HXX76_014184 [Chlamydomonas incerta]|eukprot:KAG2425027.1 hypothetical protein HXX76_014184 [Chlamydomonas incerta]
MHVPEYKLDVDGDVQLFVLNKKKRLSDYVKKFNVCDYGAIGDGLADDTDAINAAFLAAASNDMVYFPAGNYKVRQATAVAAKGVVVAGDGRGVSIITRVGNEPVFVVTGADVTIQGLGMDGNSESYPVGSTLVLGQSSGLRVLGCALYRSPGSGITLTGATLTCATSTVADCDVYDCKGAGILLNKATDCMVLGCRVQRSQLDGITVQQNCQRCIVSSNFVALNCLTGGLAGISIDNSNDIAVVRNVVSQTKTDRPGFCTPNNQGPSFRLQVSGNQLFDNMGGGVYLRNGPGGATTYSHVLDNTIQNNALFGVRIDLGSLWNIVAHNHVLDNTASAANNIIDNGGVNNEIHRNMCQRPIINKLDMHDNLGVNTRTPEYPLDINASAILRERFDVDGSIEVRGAKSVLRGSTVTPIRVLVGPGNPGTLLNGIVVENTSNAANQHAAIALRTAGAAAGNPYVAYDVAGGVQSWTHGIDQVDRGKFKLRTGLTFLSDGVDRLTVEPAGAVLITGNSLCITGSVQDGQDGARVMRGPDGNTYVDVRNASGKRGFIFRTGTSTGTEAVLAELDGQAGAIRLNGNTTITGTNHTVYGNVTVQGVNITTTSNTVNVTTNISTHTSNTLAVTAAVSALTNTPALSLYGVTTTELSGTTMTVGNASTAALNVRGTASTHACNTLAVTAAVSALTNTPALSLYGVTTTELSGTTMTVGNASTAALNVRGTASTHACNTLAVTAAVSALTNTPALSLYGVTTTELSGTTMTVGNASTAALNVRGTASTHACNTLAVTAAVSALTNTPALSLYGVTTTELSGTTMTVGNASTAALNVRGTASTHACNTLAVTAAVSALTNTPALSLYGVTTTELSGTTMTVGNASTAALNVRGTASTHACNTLAVTAAVSALTNTPALSLYGVTTTELSGTTMTVGNASTAALNVRGTASTHACNTLAVTAAVSALTNTPALSLYGVTTTELSGTTMTVGNASTAALNEVQAIVPEVVHVADDGYMAVSYMSLVALLVESVKGLQAQVDALSQSR